MTVGELKRCLADSGADVNDDLEVVIDSGGSTHHIGRVIVTQMEVDLAPKGGRFQRGFVPVVKINTVY